MRDGFYANINEHGLLVLDEVKNGIQRNVLTQGIAEYLIDYSEENFDAYTKHLAEHLSFERSDLDSKIISAVYSHAQGIVQHIPDSIGAHFTQYALDQLEPIEECAVKEALDAYLFRIWRAVSITQNARGMTLASLELLSHEDVSQKDRAERFIKSHHSMHEYLFEQAFAINDAADGPMFLWRTHIRVQVELITFCIFALIERNINIRCCTCCGKYFVPKTKRATLYCDRIAQGDKTCKQIGPALTRKIKKQYVKPIAEYDRIYAMHYARMQRYEGRADLNRPRTVNDLSQEEFFAWSRNVKQRRQQFLMEELSEDEFLDGLGMKS